MNKNELKEFHRIYKPMNEIPLWVKITCMKELKQNFPQETFMTRIYMMMQLINEKGFNK